MKHITLLLFILLLPYQVSGQFYEHFTDNDLSSNPTWTGNTDLFIVSNGTLQSNYTSKRSGYISTSLSLSDSICWYFDCGLNFGATSSTFVHIYLISDTENPINCNNGYFLALKSGVVSLCKIKNKAISILATAPDLPITSYSMYQYKIERRAGSWQIEVRNGSVLTQVFAYNEQQPLYPSGFFSVMCSLNTNSSLSGFTSKFIETTSLKGSENNEKPDPEPNEPEEPEIPDTPEEDDLLTPITVNAAVPLDSVTLRILLNQKVDLSALSVKILFLDDNPSFSTTSSENEILIRAATPFIVGTQYTVMLGMLKHITTGTYKTISTQFTYFPPITRNPSLRISELMLNPNGVKGIPPVEYVEIYNSSSQPVNLNGYGLLYGDKRYIMPSITLPSNKYAILTHEKNEHLFAPSTLVVPMLSFPTLNNTSKSVGLSNSARQTIQQFTYSSSWYGSALSAQGGYSLECIDLNNPLNDATNWSASVAPEGGTPGKKNSIERINIDNTQARVIEISHPYDDQLRIRFSKEMNITDLQNTNHYQLANANLWVKLANATIAEPTQVTLFLNKSLSPTDRTTISIDGLKCRSEHPILPLSDYPIALPITPLPEDIVINELLTNPKDGGCDYIELYNKSSHMIDLSDLLLSSRNTLGEMVSRKIITSDRIGFPPNHYLLLTTDTAWVSKEYGDRGAHRFRKVASIPTMNNKSGNIVLLNRSLNILDEFCYEESMHSSIMKDKKGIALERLSPVLPTQDLNNWGSASASFRYGTPGYENSQKYDFQTADKPFVISPKVIVPNSGHRNDHLNIQYELPPDEHWVDIQVCNLKGYVLKNICTRSLLSGKGIFTWDGKTDRGTRVQKGIYIIYIRTMNKKRVTKVYRHDMVVG